MEGKENTMEGTSDMNSNAKTSEAKSTKLSAEMKKFKKDEKRKNKIDEHKKAAQAYIAGEFPSISAAARAFNVLPRTLAYGLKNNDGEFKGAGKFSTVFQPEEEKQIVDHINWKASIGYGETWETLRLLIQEVLTSIVSKNPARITGMESTGQLPHPSWVRRFAGRHNLVLRKTSTISNGRAIISPLDIAMWFNDIQKYIFSHPDLQEALGDPRRVWNQDETAVELGVSSQHVLVKQNTRQVYQVSSNTREHVSVSYMVNAAGEMVPPRCVFAGKRNIAKTKLNNLPTDGASGEWGFSYSDNGWVKSDTFLDIINDMSEYIKKHDIQTPILLFIDGASCHVSLAMAELCNSVGIQPLLLRPNTTHLCQALDVTFFSSLKAGFKKQQERWHRNPENIGNSLNKYSVIPLLQTATEEILASKPHLIINGFKKSGISPWDPSAPTAARMAPSQIYVDAESNQMNDDVTISVKDQEPGPSSVNVDPEPQLFINGSSPPSIPDTSSPTINEEVTLPAFTPRFLKQFELLLTESQLEQFEQLFNEKLFEVENPQFQAWLLLKHASLPIEERNALKEMLSARMPKNIPKRKKRKGPSLPTGAHRYVPNSPEFMEILESRKALSLTAGKKGKKTTKASSSLPPHLNPRVSLKKMSLR